MDENEDLPHDFVKEKLKDKEVLKHFTGNYLKKDIAYQLTKARKEEGLTQAELAAMCKIPQSNISRLENGHHSPNLETVIAVASELGYQVEVTFKKI